MVVSEELLPPAVLRSIGDKLYEKRKVAALEVEQVIKRLATAGEHHRIRAIVDKLIAEYAFSPQANHRKGALLCLAAATVGLGDPNEAYLRQIVPPVLASFTDQDSRVRYYACESLYNIAKVSREGFVAFFSEAFDAMFRLCADPEANVQNAVAFLDNLVKDIVTASPAFSVDAFVPKLRDYLRVTNPYKRQFLISWVGVLQSVPDLDLLAYLPELLDGLLNLLSDPNREIRVSSAKVLMEFLVEIQVSRTVDWGALAAILVDKAENSQDDFTRLTALKWLKEFVEMAGGQLVGRYGELIGAVLPNISHASRDIQQASRECNDALLNLSPSEEAAGRRVDTAAVLAVVSREIRSEREPTRLEALRWIHFLLVRNEAEVFGQLAVLLAALLDALGSSSEKVVAQALSVLGSIAGHPLHFRSVLLSLLDRFRGDAGLVLLHRGGALVIRRLCAAMGPEKVFREFASVLGEEGDLAFASTMVQALNLILLTSAETRDLRRLLRDASTSPAGAAAFTALYGTWAHSAGAALALCLLAQAYDQARAMVEALAEMDVGAELLVQVDRLVQLLEAPAFTFLRLQLLHPGRHPDLLRACYSLLMLLPQGGAFRTLQARLNAAPTLALIQLDGSGGAAAAKAAAGKRGNGSSDWAPWGELLESFVARQREHLAAEERRARAGAGDQGEEEGVRQQEQQQQAADGGGVSGGSGGGAGGPTAAPPSPRPTGAV